MDNGEFAVGAPTITSYTQGRSCDLIKAAYQPASLECHPNVKIIRFRFARNK